MENRFLVSPYFLDELLPELNDIIEPGWSVNKPVLNGDDTQLRMSKIHSNIAQFVEESMLSGHRPVSIAGDCCSAIGFLSGMQRAGKYPDVAEQHVKSSQ